MTFDKSTFLDLLVAKKVNEALEYKDFHIPSKLYKYVALSNRYCERNGQPCVADQYRNEKKFDALSDNDVWMTRIDRLNDPYESRAVYLRRQTLVDNGIQPEILQSLIDKARTRQVVGCFTSLKNSVPMWTYYADSHSGYCVEYKVHRPRAFFPAFYEEERIGVARTLARLLDLTAALQEGIISGDNQELCFYTQLFTSLWFIKDSSWQHEKEYRIIYPCSSDVDGEAIPVSMLGLETTGVYIGLNCSDQNRLRLTRIAEEKGFHAYLMDLDEDNPRFELTSRHICMGTN